MQPNCNSASVHPNNGRPPNGVIIKSSALIEPLPIVAIWLNNLAAGKFHLLAGQPGTGKTTIAIEIAAILSNGSFGGRCWPDQTFAPQGDTVFWSGEDHAADTLIPRLMAAGANLSRVHIVEGTVEHGRARAFDFRKDIDKLSEALGNLLNPKLIVIDSIIQAVSGDSNKNSEVRKGLAPLIELAERHCCAILGITHVNKSSRGKEPIDRVTGSLAYVAVARVVMFAARMDAESGSGMSTCALVRAKSNIGSSDGGFKYHIESTVMTARTGVLQSSRIRWGEALQGSAKEILKYAEGSTATEKTSAVEAAADFLVSILSSGDLTFPEIEAKSKEANISKASLTRAKARLGIVSRKQCGIGSVSPHIWQMPRRQDDSFVDYPRSDNLMPFGDQKAHVFNPQHFESYVPTSQTEQMTVRSMRYGSLSLQPAFQNMPTLNGQIFGQSQLPQSQGNELLFGQANSIAQIVPLAQPAQVERVASVAQPAQVERVASVAQPSQVEQHDPVESDRPIQIDEPPQMYRAKLMEALDSERSSTPQPQIDPLSAKTHISNNLYQSDVAESAEDANSFDYGNEVNIDKEAFLSVDKYEHFEEEATENLYSDSEADDDEDSDDEDDADFDDSNDFDEDDDFEPDDSDV